MKKPIYSFFIDFIYELLNYTGFLRFGLFYKDVWFYISLMTAFIFYCVLSFFIPVSIGIDNVWRFLFFQIFFVVFAEELFFRGFLIPTLNKYVDLNIVFISFGNAISAVLFAFAHLFSHSLFWSMGTFFPALIFGYFREKNNSIWPAIILHFFYNIGYFYIF